MLRGALTDRVTERLVIELAGDVEVVLAVTLEELFRLQDDIIDRCVHDLGLVSLSQDSDTGCLVLLGGDAANHKNGLVHGRLPFARNRYLRSGNSLTCVYTQVA